MGVGRLSFRRVVGVLEGEGRIGPFLSLPEGKPCRAGERRPSSRLAISQGRPLLPPCRQSVLS